MRFVSVTAVSLAFGTSLGAQPRATPRLKALDDSVRRFVGEQAPGVAIGIVRDGAVLHTAYFGEADLSHRVPVGPASRFNVASNGKQFTAAVILSLVQDGRLSLDTSVNELLPDALPLVAERVSARRFASWGMPATEFFTDDTEVVPNRTRPYGDNNGAWQEYPNITTVHGDGGLFTTLPDQLAWEVRLQSGYRAGGSASLERVSQTPVTGASVTRYGYGVELGGEYRGLPYAFRDGSTGAYNARFMRFPSQRVSVVVMSSSGRINVNGLAMQYADALLAGTVASGATYPARPSVIGARVDESPWLGDYRASSGTIISLARTDSGLVRRIPGSPDTRLLPDTGNVYRYATNAALKIALDRDSVGEPQFTIYLPTQAPITGRRLAPSSVLATDAWIGRYVNAETGAEVVIAAVEGERLLARVGGWSGKAIIVRPNLVIGGGYELEPSVGASGSVDAIVLNGGRIRQVLFERARPRRARPQTRASLTGASLAGASRGIIQPLARPRTVAKSGAARRLHAESRRAGHTYRFENGVPWNQLPARQFLRCCRSGC